MSSSNQAIRKSVSPHNEQRPAVQVRVKAVAGGANPSRVALALLRHQDGAIRPWMDLRTFKSLRPGLRNYNGSQDPWARKLRLYATGEFARFMGSTLSRTCRAAHLLYQHGGNFGDRQRPIRL